ncbi:hypothetical protein SSPIM334S_00966 [Streptomyces spiroverticillatus]
MPRAATGPVTALSRNAGTACYARTARSAGTAPAQQVTILPYEPIFHFQVPPWPCW